MTTKRPISGRRRLVLFLFLTGVAGTTLLECRSRNSGVVPAAERGASRELTFTLLDGGTWRLQEERGRVVAVNLWATWCGPCRSETPMLLRVNNDLYTQGFRVVGVSLDTGRDKEARVRDFKAAYHVAYPIAFPDSLSQIESGLEGIPTTLLFDRRGRPAKVYVGELRESSLRADVSRLLTEPELPAAAKLAPVSPARPAAGLPESARPDRIEEAFCGRV